MSNAARPAKLRSRTMLKLAACALVIAIGAGVTFSLNAAKAAPEVTFVNLQGTKIALSSLRGKVVMVNFWATSCATCIKEMPQMVDTFKRYHDQGLDFVAVAMTYDPPSYVLNFTQTRQLPFTVALDPQSSLAKAFGDVSMTPTTFLIDKQGKIIKRYVGEPDFPALRRLLESALAA